MTIRPKDRKLAELILFISERSEGDPRFGAAKLNKLLFYSDFAAFLLFGKSISGQEYQKLAGGPGPIRLMVVREALVERKELAIRNVDSFNRKQERPFALRSAALAEFTADEIALVTKIIQQSWERDASESGYFSKDSVHWDEYVEISETIPYEMAFLSKRPPTENDLKHCEESASLAAAVFANPRKVRLIDAQAFLDGGVRKPTRRSGAARAAHPAKPVGTDATAARPIADARRCQ